MEPIATLHGIIVHGNGLGRTVGMPTANLSPSRGCEIPPAGVYASRVLLSDGAFIGVTNIGARPTVDRDSRATIETNIHAFDRDIYGQPLRLEFVRRIRPERKFASIDELSAQLCRDAQEIRALLDAQTSSGK